MAPVGSSLGNNNERPPVARLLRSPFFPYPSRSPDPARSALNGCQARAKPLVQSPARPPPDESIRRDDPRSERAHQQTMMNGRRRAARDAVGPKNLPPLDGQRRRRRRRQQKQQQQRSQVGEEEDDDTELTLASDAVAQFARRRSPSFWRCRAASGPRAGALGARSVLGRRAQEDIERTLGGPNWPDARARFWRDKAAARRHSNVAAAGQ